MAYEKLNWQDGKAPAVSAENLNHMDEGIAGAQQTADEAKEAIANDPLGAWKYGGKFTAMGSGNKIEFHKVEEGDNFSNVVNEFFIKINDIQTDYSATHGYQLVLCFSCSFENNLSRTMNIYLSDFTGKPSISALKGCVFRFNKIGTYGSDILYSPTSYTSDYSISKAYMINVPAGWVLSKMEAYLNWNYANQITALDADLYYR